MRRLSLEYHQIEHKGEGHIKNNFDGRITTLIDRKTNDYCLWYVVCHVCRLEVNRQMQMSCRKPNGNFTYLVTKYDTSRRNSLHELEDQMYQAVAVFPSFWSRVCLSLPALRLGIQRWTTYSPGDSARTWVKWVGSEATVHAFSRLLLNATRTDPPRARGILDGVCLARNVCLLGRSASPQSWASSRLSRLKWLSIDGEPITAAGNTFLLCASPCDLLRF
ncbi:hypothetical protein BD309DRAFT_91428 [Dichomitus squalens]|nr:hypothetical protein BD309DRAFT_91428 [Dichomitus squalens]